MKGFFIFLSESVFFIARNTEAAPCGRRSTFHCCSGVIHCSSSSAEEKKRKKVNVYCPNVIASYNVTLILTFVTILFITCKLKLYPHSSQVESTTKPENFYKEERDGEFISTQVCGI